MGDVTENGSLSSEDSGSKASAEREGTESIDGLSEHGRLSSKGSTVYSVCHNWIPPHYTTTVPVKSEEVTSVLPDTSSQTPGDAEETLFGTSEQTDRQTSPRPLSSDGGEEMERGENKEGDGVKTLGQSHKDV